MGLNVFQSDIIKIKEIATLHIQINNTTITQEQLQKLSPDKLSQIEGLIKDAEVVN